MYGDCCKDSKYYNQQEQTVMQPESAAGANIYNNSRYGCYKVEGLKYESLIIAKCPRTFVTAEETALDREIRDKCENVGDFISGYPVTGTLTGHVYKNTYCAWCHGDRNRIVYWKPLFRCYGPNGLMNTTFQLEDGSDRTLLYRDGQWYYADYKYQMLRKCTFELQQPKVEAMAALRKCVSARAGLVDGCPAGTPAPLARACASHTYHLYEHKPDKESVTRTFRNMECARCNNVTAKYLKCSPPPPSLKTNFGFNVLFQGAYKRHAPCSQDELYDVLATKCRDVHEELHGACRKYVEFKTGEYDNRSVNNGSMYVYQYKKWVRYRKKANDGTVDVCTEDADGLLQPVAPSAYTRYLLYTGIGGSSASTVALIAHLALFSFNGAEPKNLPEKNLASLSVSLLLGYCGYLTIALQAMRAGPNWPCIASALTMQFGFLAAFAWMFIMSVDVWIVLNASTKKLRVVGGQRNGRFAAYSAFAWLAPAALTAFTAALQLSADPAVPGLRPNFQYNCWFRNPQSLVALFVLPAGTTIAANYVSFMGTVRLIAASGVDKFKTAGSSSTAAVNRVGKNFKIYVRLSLMMGLAWVFGLAGALTDSDIVWTVYTVLNSLQGAFIFLAFDYSWTTAKTLAAFRKVASVSDTQTTNNTPLSATN